MGRRHPVHRAALVLLFVASVAIDSVAAEPRDQLDLAGTWSLQLDPEDQGIEQQWFTQSLGETIQLPDSLQAQGFGKPPTLESEWTGSIRPEVIQMARYAPYREPDNFKMPFWLQPKRCFVGPAWYQREVVIPQAWSRQRITLHLERCHWFTQVWVDNQDAGTANSLSTPHVYDLTRFLSPGKHRLTIRVDNRLLINVGHNSHSVTDHTQTNWNGIIGDISLRVVPQVSIARVEVYPHIKSRTAEVRTHVSNRSGKPANVELSLSVFQDGKPLATAGTALYVEGETLESVVTLSLGDEVKLWSEHDPQLCNVEVSLFDGAAADEVIDRHAETFGMREIDRAGRQFLINGQPAYFRGTLECCIFPLTGFPSTDVESWKRIVRRCKEFGLNHMRFHSWCPPEAAFVAADELGFYYQVECASWANGGASVGNQTSLDQWLYDEADRILSAYGNHPSFVLLAYGNEPSGPGPRHQGEIYLGKWVDHYKQVATRQLVTAASGWPYIPENQYHVMHRPLRQRGVFNSQVPETTKDYRQHVEKYDVPLISHETGQWCVFPNLDEIAQYTGVLQAKNFEIVRDFLQSHKLLHQAREFLIASGQLQTLLYKEEIEVMLRTPELGGFQLLDLHDFPGQGTALIGVLDPFWEPKPYITAERFRQFCGRVVPLARLESRTWTNDQEFDAEVEVYQFGGVDLLDRTVEWTLRSDAGQTIGEGRWDKIDLPRGGLRGVGNLQCTLAAVKTAARLKLTVSIADTPYRNQWDVWVYPAKVSTAPGDDVLITREFDKAALDQLESGGKVLFLPPAYSIAGDTYGSFEAIFWNRLWFPTQQTHTLGVLCDPSDAALQAFPTDSYCNWQWWDLCRRSKPMIMDELPSDIRPIVQVIDDWNSCRKLGMVFEAKVGEGKLLVCSADLRNDLDSRPVARQLRYSLLKYMASDQFAPEEVVTAKAIETLLREPTVLQRLGATITADSHQPGYEPSNVIDNNPSTIWHTAWGNDAPRYPHYLTIDLRGPQSLSGLTYLPRADMTNGRVARFAIYASRDSTTWGDPVATGTWPNSKELKTVRFESPVTARFIKLVCESEVRDQSFASAAELDVILAADDSDRLPLEK